MLRAFQRQLNELAMDYDKNFENHVKARWGKKLPKGLLEDLKDFVKLLPQIERKIFSLYAWLPAGSRVKKVGFYFLTYMYQPDDFLPANEKYGLFGYLDDAYMAALFYELMIEEIQLSTQFRLRKHDIDLLHELIRLKRKARSVITEEAIKIKQMLGELFEDDQTTFQELFKDKVVI